MNNLIHAVVKEIKTTTYGYLKNIIYNGTMSDEYLKWFNDLPKEYWNYAREVFIIFEQYIAGNITQEQAKLSFDTKTQKFIQENAFVYG